MGRKRRFKQRLSPLQLRIFSFLAWFAVSILCLTVRFRSVGEEKLFQGKGRVMMTWHGQQLPGYFYFRRRAYAIIVSLSKDGDLASSIMRRFGWKIIRGSSNRGGARALIEMIRLLRQGGVVAVTPDGPSGPLYHIEPGVIYMAQKTESELVPCSFVMDRFWEFNSWDRFVVPKPFSKCVVYFGTELSIPSKLSEDEFELAKERAAAVLHEANELGRKELEAWIGD